ncbi:PIN domain-containing protein [Patescibacteria group bacterium]|nr:PIN domain-containing protein [Patescibacteria group bacterium]
MTNRIFCDTSAVIALANKKDQYHNQAAKKLKSFLKVPDNTLLVTTHILAETVTRVQQKVSKDAAIKVGNMLMQNPRIEIMNPPNSIIEKAWSIFQKYKDQDFSLVDCISFAVMQDLKIKKAFAFDKHFKTMKFEIV